MPEIVTLGLVVPYRMLFGDFDISKRLEFIKDIPAREMLHELASLNYRIKPSTSFNFNSDPYFQNLELFYFSGGNVDLMNYIVDRINQWLSGRPFQSKAIIFDRPANLFAMGEILANNHYSEPAGFKWSQPAWERFLKYYLCVNEVVGRYTDQSSTSEYDQWEKFAAGSLFLTELSVVSDPFLTLNRFVKLFNDFNQDK